LRKKQGFKVVAGRLDASGKIGRAGEGKEA